MHGLDLLSFWSVGAEDAVLADWGFEDYEREDRLRALGVRLCPLRRRGSRRRGSEGEERVRARGRRAVVERVLEVEGKSGFCSVSLWRVGRGSFGVLAEKGEGFFTLSHSDGKYGC